MVDEKLPQIAEDEDLARAKALWNEHGKSLITGIIIGLAGIVGFNYWGNYQQSQGEEASDSYEIVRVSDSLAEVENVVSTLKLDYADTPYAALSGLKFARMLVEEGNLDAAETELSWVLENTKDAAIQHIARLRLASVMIGNNSPDEALKLLSVSDKGTFEARYDELLGDAYMAREQEGDRELARKSYQASLEKLQGSSNSVVVQLKLDHIGDS